MPACPQASIQSATTHVEMKALEAVQGWQVLVAPGTTKGRDWGRAFLSAEIRQRVTLLKFLQLSPGMGVRVYSKKGDHQYVLAEEVLQTGSPRSPNSCAATRWTPAQASKKSGGAVRGGGCQWWATQLWKHLQNDQKLKAVQYEKRGVPRWRKHSSV